MFSREYLNYRRYGIGRPEGGNDVNLFEAPPGPGWRTAGIIPR
jgi:hypothetical protein